MDWVLWVLTPVILHLVCGGFVSAFTENVLDAASCTALTALTVLPCLLWMYREDCRRAHGRRDSDSDFTESRRKAAVRRNSFSAAAAVVSFLGGAVLNIFWSAVLDLLSIQSYFSNETQEALLSGSWEILVFGLCFMVPLAEELIFRGLVFRRMRERLSFGWALLFSSVLFALYHGNPIQMIFSFPMALLLAFLCEKSGSVILPFSFHMGVNLAAVIETLF